MMTSSLPNILHLQLREGVCVTAYLPDAGHGAVACLAPDQIRSTELATALESLSLQLGVPWSSATLKVVGPAALVASVKDYSESIGGRVEWVAERSERPVDLYFYPTSGRLRF